MRASSSTIKSRTSPPHSADRGAVVFAYDKHSKFMTVLSPSRRSRSGEPAHGRIGFLRHFHWRRMTQERLERRLTAILAADVAGYSRLMGMDEEGTLAALKKVRGEVADPRIAEHRGRIVQTAGDSLLV